MVLFKLITILVLIQISYSIVGRAQLLLSEKNIDYDPYGKNATVFSPEMFGITETTVKTLFQDEIDKILVEGPSNHFWNLFLDFLPRRLIDRKSSTTKSNRVIKPNQRRIFTRQADTEVNNSPLAIKSKVHLASQSSDEAREIDASSTVGLKVSAKIANSLIDKNFDFNPVPILANIKAPNELCPFKQNINCDPNERFSSLDGSCNNLDSPWFGKANTPYKRYQEPAYDDKLNNPRSKSVLGGDLPNPRIISRALFTDNHEFHNIASHIVAIFGQFLAHDITSAAVSSDNFGRIIDCSCNNGNPSCMSINMPSNENVMRMSCMRFTRSSAAFPTFDCRLGHREQLNLLTSLIDCTQIYGPTDSRSKDLRSFQGGQLKTSQGVNLRPNLPQAQDGACHDTDSTIKCFAAGEGRVNENVALTGIHTLFLREHNRIAFELSRVNPRWDDERLFNEARKIMIGIMQHIVYNEWVPIIVGWNTAGLFDLVPLSGKQYYSGYNPSINPALANEFATAAFRFGHTLVRNSLKRFDGNNKETSSAVSLFDIIFRPVEAYNAQAGGIDGIVLGLINEPAGKYDPNIADALQNRLFEVRLSDNSVIAIDLAATNLNRGRDHGIPSYNFMREKCGLKRASSFQDLVDVMNMDKIMALSNLYQHVDDIDLYAGGLSENPVNGGIVGPTFSCIIANQFKDLKKGDRFYYENGPSNTAFTLDQLNEIKKSTLSKIICNNFDISMIQPNAFLQPLETLNNRKISCSWLPSMDFTKWQE